MVGNRERWKKEDQMSTTHSDEDRAAYWDALYSSQTTPLRDDCAWIDRYFDSFPSSARVLELGCGTGRLAEYLTSHGHVLTCVDVAPAAIRRLTERFEPYEAQVLDISRPLPWRSDAFDVVVADLSLHYFDEATTNATILEIRRVLVAGGVLLARVNSVDDTAHGAGQGEEIEPGFYRDRGHYKRFFDEQAIVRFFGCFEIGSIREAVTQTGVGRKCVIEVMARNRSGGEM